MAKKTATKSPCHKCTGLCCRYFALPIDKPKKWSDYDDIRWYLCHDDVSVFVEKGDWYVNVGNKCRYLSDRHRCDNYDMRPKICRKYKTDDCDITSDDYDYTLHFTGDKQMEDYMRKKFGPRIFDRLSRVGRTAKQAKRKKTR